MKKQSTQIFCDSCNADISPRSTGYPNNYILKVVPYNIEIIDGAVFACIVHPPIDHDLYFCGVQCMKNYDPTKKVK